MKGEVSRPSIHYTGAEWVNREGPNLSPWPKPSKLRGAKTSGAQKALLFVKKLEKGWLK